MGDLGPFFPVDGLGCGWDSGPADERIDAKRRKNEKTTDVLRSLVDQLVGVCAREAGRRRAFGAHVMSEKAGGGILLEIRGGGVPTTLLLLLSEVFSGRLTSALRSRGVLPLRVVCRAVGCGKGPSALGPSAEELPKGAATDPHTACTSRPRQAISTVPCPPLPSLKRR